MFVFNTLLFLNLASGKSKNVVRTMSAKQFIFYTILVFTSLSLSAQSVKLDIKHHIIPLSGNSMHGRGYVNKGGEKAASYIFDKLKAAGVMPMGKDGSYLQRYYFSINTFPRDVYLSVNKDYLQPGTDYIVHAASSAYYNEKKIKLHHVNLAKVKDSATWASVKSEFQPRRAYYLKNTDTLNKYLKLGLRSFAKELPKGLFVVPTHGKLTWLACTDTVAATIIYAEDTVLPRHPRKVQTKIDTKFIPDFKAYNVMGFVPGTERPDSFIVFTAHYDHLGRMGSRTIFPGAHDNASGTALVLFLAEYFAKHPQRYSTAFIFFSGEEAGLLGSKHYVKYPEFPLENIKFVVNLDMTGDATNGITVVNGDSCEKEFAILEKINGEKGYLPKIVKRSQTQNSDHYSFSQAGVPAIFIYGNGTKPYYHDVFDTYKQLSMEHIDDLVKLLIEFTRDKSEGQ